MSQTKSRKIPTRKILPLFFMTRHLTPLKAILQLRPGFNHINEADLRKMEKTKGASAHPASINAL